MASGLAGSDGRAKAKQGVSSGRHARRRNHADGGLPPSISPWDERVRGGLGPQFVGAGWSIGRPALRAPSRNSVSALPPRCPRSPRAHRGVPRDPGADRAALAPHLQGADPLLQDRRRVHGVSERPSGPLRHGRRPGERPLAASTSPSCSASPTPPACCATPSSRPRACARSWRCTASRDRRSVGRWRLVDRGDDERAGSWALSRSEGRRPSSAR